jgi:hypothetical protein
VRETIRIIVVGLGPSHWAVRLGAFGFVIATALLVLYEWRLDAAARALVILGAGAISVAVIASYHALVATKEAADASDMHLAHIEDLLKRIADRVAPTTSKPEQPEDPREDSGVIKKVHEAVVGKASVSASLSVATHMALHWARIAIRNAELARRARVALTDAQSRGTPLPMDTELQPALVAVSAAAHALDALYAELKPLVVSAETAEAWKKNGTKRREQIRETLKLGFRIGDEWRDDFQWLFDLRDDAVHPDFSFGDPYAREHPLGLNAAREYSVFTCEEAERAARLIVEVYSVCVASPKTATADWAEQMRGSSDSLRSGLATLE